MILFQWFSAAHWNQIDRSLWRCGDVVFNSLAKLWYDETNHHYHQVDRALIWWDRSSLPMDWPISDMVRPILIINSLAKLWYSETNFHYQQIDQVLIWWDWSSLPMGWSSSDMVRPMLIQVDWALVLWDWSLLSMNWSSSEMVQLIIIVNRLIKLQYGDIDPHCQQFDQTKL